MPVIIWIKNITIPSWLDLTKDTDYVSNYMNTNNLRKWNVYCFFTIFFIPLIPLFCRQSVWIDKEWDPIYKREVTTGWKIVNQLFWIVWILILFILLWWVAGSIGWWHVHRIHY